MKKRTFAEEFLIRIKKSKIMGKVYVPLRMIPMRFLHLVYFFRSCRYPIRNNKILFIWYKNEKFCCNMKAVVLELLRSAPERYDIVCCFSDRSALNDLPEGVRGITLDSPEALYEFASSKIWFMNDTTTAVYLKGIQKRKGQILFQTWHGSLGIKRIGQMASIAMVNRWHVYIVSQVSKWFDYWISNSEFESDVYRTSFPCVNEILLYGHPRNDRLLISGKKTDPEIKKLYGLGDKKILLYAPSHRNDQRRDCYNIDGSLITSSLSARFGGDWVIMYRLHHQMKEIGQNVIPGSDQMIDVTDYPDIQDLMLGVDALLTDYSSCIFDFMFTGRPGFIYAPDLDTYQMDRGFYYPLESTPFPIGKTNEELAEKIRMFDEEKYARDCAAFLKDKGCMEDGHAAERVAGKINELTGFGQAWE